MPGEKFNSGVVTIKVGLMLDDSSGGARGVNIATFSLYEVDFLIAI